MFEKKYRKIHNFFSNSQERTWYGKTITCKIKFIDSFRFMSSSLSSLVDNLSEDFHNTKREECDSCRDYIGSKDEKLHFECFDCRKKYKKLL